MKKIKKALPWALTLSWMALIFFLSHQPATESASLSTGVMAQVIKLMEKIAPGLHFDMALLHYFIRKNAHFTVYLVLGVLVFNSLRRTETLKLTKAQLILVAVLICVLYAISDEVHQVFIPGRAGQIKDVLIDSAGAIVGVGGLVLLH